jgi:hypothetical protein
MKNKGSKSMAVLEKAVLAAIMMNTTHYVDIGAPKDAVIYYENATTMHMVLPDGTAMSGSWNLTDDGYFVKWTGGPEGDWKLNYAPGRISYIDKLGKDLGPITKIIYGNPEKLPK